MMGFLRIKISMISLSLFPLAMVLMLPLKNSSELDFTDNNQLDRLLVGLLEENLIQLVDKSQIIIAIIPVSINLQVILENLKFNSKCLCNLEKEGVLIRTWLLVKKMKKRGMNKKNHRLQDQGIQKSIHILNLAMLKKLI